MYRDGLQGEITVAVKKIPPPPPLTLCNSQMNDFKLKIKAEKILNLI